MNTDTDPSADSRNIIDDYKGWTLELIKQDLIQKRFGYAVLMQQFSHDFNIGTVIRNANIFAANEVFYLGAKKKYDKRGTVGAHHYMDNIKHLKSIDDLVSLKSRYVFVGLDIIPGICQEIRGFKFPPNALMIFGEEGAGITKELLNLCDHVVYIKQYGSVRSLNAGCASAIAMNEYVRQHDRGC